MLYAGRPITALRHAARAGHVSIVHLLLADPRLDPDINNHTRLADAGASGVETPVGRLIEEEDLPPPLLQYALAWFVRHGYVPSIQRLLLNYHVDVKAVGTHLLIAAAAEGNAAVVACLLADNRIDPRVHLPIMCTNAACRHMDVGTDPRCDPSLLRRRRYRPDVACFTYYADEGDEAHEEGKTPPVTCTNFCPDTPLEAAAAHGHVAVLDCLLAHPRINPARDRNSAVILAAKNGHAAAVTRLIADPRTDPAARVSEALLWAAHGGHLAAVEALLADKRVDPSCRNGAAFIAAAAQGRTAVVQRLMRGKRFDPTVRHGTAFCAAAAAGNVELMALLEKHSTTAPVYRLESAFIRSCAGGHTAAVERLLADERINPAAENNAAVISAAANGHAALLRLLLADGRVDPTARNSSAVVAAAAAGHAPAIAELLQDGRADPAAQDNAALMKAVKGGHAAAATTLLGDVRVDPAAQENGALIAAFRGKKAEVARVLLADPRVDPSAQGYAAAKAAIVRKNGELLSCLLHHPCIDPDQAQDWPLLIDDFALQSPGDVVGQPHVDIPEGPCGFWRTVAPVLGLSVSRRSKRVGLCGTCSLLRQVEFTCNLRAGSEPWSLRRSRARKCSDDDDDDDDGGYDRSKVDEWCGDSRRAFDHLLEHCGKRDDLGVLERILGEPGLGVHSYEFDSDCRWTWINVVHAATEDADDSESEPDGKPQAARNGSVTAKAKQAQGQHRLAVLERLLEEPRFIAQPREFGFTALFAACDVGHGPVLQQLLADTSIKLDEDALELGWASNKSAAPEAAQALLSDERVTLSDDSSPANLRRLLRYAAAAGHVELLEELLCHDAPAEQMRESLSYALTDACCLGHVAAVWRILADGRLRSAAPSVLPEALTSAVEAGHVPVIRALLASSAPGLTPAELSSAMHEAATVSSKHRQATASMGDSIAAMLAHPHSAATTPVVLSALLKRAAGNGNARLAQLVCCHRAAHRVPAVDVSDALVAAARGGHAQTLAALLALPSSCIDFAGGGNAALTAAARGGHFGGAAVLLADRRVRQSLTHSASLSALRPTHAAGSRAAACDAGTLGVLEALLADACMDPIDLLRGALQQWAPPAVVARLTAEMRERIAWSAPPDVPPLHIATELRKQFIAAVNPDFAASVLQAGYLRHLLRASPYFLRAWLEVSQISGDEDDEDDYIGIALEDTDAGEECASYYYGLQEQIYHPSAGCLQAAAWRRRRAVVLARAVALEK